MKSLPLLIAALFLLMLPLNSCKSAKEKSQNRIAELEKSLKAKTDAGMDQAKARELADCYTGFAAKYPQDTASAGYLFQAGEILVNQSDFTRSLAIFDTILHKYPGSRNAPMCLFLKAFVLDDKLKDLSKAKAAYEAFLQKYPNHPFAADAKVCLQNLGKSPEEIIRSFEEKKSGN